MKQAERRNQRSVALNYFSEEGKKVFFDLVKDADIFMEASKGGTWARKGITDDVAVGAQPQDGHRTRSPASARRATPRW